MKFSKKAVLVGLICLFLLLTAFPASSADDDWLMPEVARDYGPNRKLLGNVELFAVFVGTPRHPWTTAKRDQMFRILRTSIDSISAQARQYGVNLNLTYSYFETTLSYETSAFNLSQVDLTWYWDILKNYFYLSNMTEMQQYYETRRGKSDVAFLFFFNSEDRNYSYNAKRSYPGWDEEFAVYFCGSDLHDRFIIHELLHLYGAVDLYNRTYKENVEVLANRLFPDSVMKQTRGTIDDLTAYLIGWTNYPSAKARQYLDGIAAMR